MEYQHIIDGDGPDYFVVGDIQAVTVDNRHLLVNRYSDTSIIIKKWEAKDVLKALQLLVEASNDGDRKY